MIFIIHPKIRYKLPEFFTARGIIYPCFWGINLKKQNYTKGALLYRALRMCALQNEHPGQLSPGHFRCCVPNKGTPPLHRFAAIPADKSQNPSGAAAPKAQLCTRRLSAVKPCNKESWMPVGHSHGYQTGTAK